MKNKLLLLTMLIAVLFQQKATAQLPSVGTDEDPVWYYIQTKGDAARRLLVWTVSGTTVYGKAVNADSQASIDSQLFRFEKSGNNYYLINKATQQKINAKMEGSNVYLNVDNTGRPFAIGPIANTPYYGIQAVTAPGTADYIYVHQGNNGYSWRVILINTTYAYGESSQYSFVPYDEMNLTYSTEGNDTWYKIKSAPSLNECFEDASSSTAESIISLGNESVMSDSQLWKLVKKTGSTTVDIINKATGAVIQTQSEVDESNLLYNYTQLSPNANESKGWTLRYIGAGQYTLSGMEEDNIVRYLYAASKGSKPDNYDENQLINSSFAWKLSKVTTGTSIPISPELDHIRIYSENRRIVVEGTDDYVVRTLQGVTVNKSIVLPVGIYLVTTHAKTTKIFVQ